MAFRHELKKPELRYTVVDDNVSTWAVLDKETGEKVESDIRDPLRAKQLAERLNEQSGG